MGAKNTKDEKENSPYRQYRNNIESHLHVSMNIKGLIAKFLYQVNINNKDMNIENNFKDWLYKDKGKVLTISDQVPIIKIKGILHIKNDVNGGPISYQIMSDDDKVIENLRKLFDKLSDLCHPVSEYNTLTVVVDQTKFKLFEENTYFASIVVDRERKPVFKVIGKE